MKEKQHNRYSWYAKNYGKDLIYQTRLRLAKKLGFTPYNGRLSTRLHFYLLEAELGVILH